MLLATLPIVGTLVAAATMGATRYRVPAEVALTLLASVALASWGQRRSIRKPATLN